MSQLVLTRRSFLAASAAAAFAPAVLRAETIQPGEDGLYHQPWFIESFLDLREDFQTAQKAGKSFVVLWELRGCPYCKLLHTVNFANPKIAAFGRENFDVLQLNLIGSRPVTDLDGKQMPEKELAQRHEVSSTPTLQFFMESQGQIAIEAGRTGYLKPAEFYGMLRFVRARAYENGPFDEWLRANPSDI